MYDLKSKVNKVVGALAARPRSSTYDIASATGVMSSDVRQILDALKRKRSVIGSSSSWELDHSFMARHGIRAGHAPSYDPSGVGYGIGDNAGEIGIEITDGDLAIGIGGGLTIDTDGDLGLSIAPGISIDLSGNDGNSGFGF